MEVGLGTHKTVGNKLSIWEDAGFLVFKIMERKNLSEHWLDEHPGKQLIEVSKE